MKNLFQENLLKLMSKSILFRIDWLSILIFLLLVSFGITSIYSTTFSEIHVSIFNLGTPAGKQFLIFIFSLLLLPLILLVNTNIFEHLSNIFYIISLVSLIGLFVFGQRINGALSWYLIGGFSFQPSEFVKITTAILVSKNLSSIQIDLNKISDLIKIILIIGIPVILILLQPDPGSAIVFFRNAICFAKRRTGY